MRARSSEGAREGGGDPGGGDPVFVRAVREAIDLVAAPRGVPASASHAPDGDDDIGFQEFSLSGAPCGPAAAPAAAAARPAATARGDDTAPVLLPSPVVSARGAVIVFTAASPEDCSVGLRGCFSHEVCARRRAHASQCPVRAAARWSSRRLTRPTARTCSRGACGARAVTR